jgi:hypothetical protein
MQLDQVQIEEICDTTRLTVRINPNQISQLKTPRPRGLNSPQEKL